MGRVQHERHVPREDERRVAAMPHDEPRLTSDVERLAARYLAVFEAIPMALALVDQRLRLVSANARFRALLGLPATGDRYVHEVFPVGESDLTAAVIAAARGLPGVATTVLLRLGADARAVMASCLAIPGEPSDPHVLVVLRELREAEGSSSAAAHEPPVATAASGAEGRRSPELGAVEQARARERRLAAVGQLAAGVMHDVNNALNPIVAAAYLLQQHADDPEKVRHYANRIAAAAETGAATAARVGRFLRQEPLEATEQRLVDLGSLADEVIALTRPLWGQRASGGRIELVKELEPGVHTRGVAGEIREALLNLVHNALDAMADGGTLTVRTYATAEHAVVEVEDDGVGMAPEVADRAFDPFFSTKGGRGSGLGLAEVYGVMRRHGGTPELRTAPGIGTLVRLTFPRAVEVEDAAAAPRRPPPRRRVLVVEDNPDSREFMRALLASDGHHVEAAAGVADALALLQQRQAGDGAFDVVVTDIGLIDGSGWELAAEVRRAWPSLRVGIVTGWEATADAEGGVDFVLRKPIRTEYLLAAVVGDS